MNYCLFVSCILRPSIYVSSNLFTRTVHVWVSCVSLICKTLKKYIHMHLNLKVIQKSPILTFVINHICFNRSEYILPRDGAVLLFGLMSVYISSLCHSYRCGTLVINLQMDYGKLPHPSYFYK